MDVTISATLPLAAPDSDLSSFYDGSQHFVFEDPYGNLFQGIYWGQWGGENITLGAQAPLAWSAGTPFDPYPRSTQTEETSNTLGFAAGDPAKEYVHMGSQVVAVETRHSIRRICPLTLRAPAAPR